MRKIEVAVGYYEWHILIDDKLVYVFGDMEWEECFLNHKELSSFINLAIDCISDEASTDENEYTGFCDRYGDMQANKELWLTLTNEEINAIKNELYKAWERYL